MSAKSMLTIGFLSMMAATGVVNASDSLAAHRVDVIGTINQTLAQADSVKAGFEWRRVDVLGTIGFRFKGPVYPYSMGMSH